MDGYAIRAADVAGATEAAPVRLTVVGESRAGVGARRPGDARRPRSGSRPVRRCRRRRRRGAGRAHDAARCGRQPRAARPRRGRAAAGGVPRPRARRAWATRSGARASDVEAGATVVPAGDHGDAGRGGARGGRRARRRRRPPPARSSPSSRPATRSARPGPTSGRPGSRTRTAPGSAALVREAGGEPLELGIAADRLEDVEARLRRGLAEADIVVVSGGVSVGPYDVVRHGVRRRRAHQPVARRRPAGQAVRVRPRRRRRPGGTRCSLFGLPGNPVSSFVTFELFVRPVIRRLAGPARLHRPVDRAVLEEAVTKSKGRRGYQRVIVDAGRGRLAGARRARAGSACGSRAGRGATCSRRSPPPTRSR